ncbi:hypothetical protein [Acinetobacter baumannii]|uniref:hypothetical protein n=1 Tax=Acinetobacter baumannii TaxID=470 RepID=UPI0011C4C6C0|nr:hypothetical protein [Acinetobacter baumannii]
MLWPHCKGHVFPTTSLPRFDPTSVQSGGSHRVDHVALGPAWLTGKTEGSYTRGKPGFNPTYQ